MSDKYDVIIVGGGVGGLTIAALLTKEGIKTLLLEKNDRIGGKATTFSKAGFKYELWPIGYMPLKDNRFQTLFTELGILPELKPAWDYESDEQLVGFYYRGRSGEYRQLTDSRPKNTSDPDVLFDLWELDAQERESALTFLTELVMMPTEQVDELDDISMHEYMSRYDIPAPLYEYLAMHSNISILEPVDLVSASELVRVIQEMAMQGAAGYFKGGYSRVLDIIEEKIKTNGGAIRTGGRVEKIEVQNGQTRGVRTPDGLIEAPIVVSDAGIQPTVFRLVGEEHFNANYVEWARNLVPGFTLLTTRYFLNKRVLDRPLYLVYSGDTVCNTERYARIKSGEVPEDVTIWAVVPCNYDPDMAPPDKQCAIFSTFCSPDPEATELDILWNKIDDMVAKIWPDVIPAIESKERGGPAEVSKQARDHVLSGQGGEAIGLGQVVSQCGKHKPSPESPISGLFYVGTDAGGGGVGSVQAVDSGMNVAKMVSEYYKTYKTS